MNRNMNNFTPLPGSNWRTGVRAYDSHTSNNRESNEVPVFFRSRSTQVTDDRISGVEDPLRFWEIRNPIGFQSVPDFPTQPNRRPQVYVHNNDDMGRGFNFNPRHRGIFLQPPPRSTTTTTFQPSTQVPPPMVENSKSKVLSKLRKVVYNPTPKRLARRLSLYYRNNNNGVNSLKEREKENEEVGKRCAICLDDFEPKKEVLLTPCNHMFHEDCIVPWLTSKGQCPICRFVICEGERGNPTSFNSDGIANLEPSDLIAEELLSILRAMEEAFHLGSRTH